MARKNPLRISKNIFFSFLLLSMTIGAIAQFGEPTLISDSPYQPEGFGADIDGDGDIDVIYSDDKDGSVFWLENLGEGNFSPHQLITSEWLASISILPSDLDGDGDMDLLIWDLGRLLAWHENSGEGTFSAGQILAQDQSIQVRNVAVVDFNDDGDEDILFMDNFHIYLIEQIGNGTFTDPIIVIEYEIIWETILINYAVLDLDNDGLKDIIQSKKTMGLGWCRNLGNYEFEPFEIIDPSVEVETSNHSKRELVVYDFNEDGKEDLFYANLHTIWVFENMNEGLFEPGVEILSVADDLYTTRFPDIEIGHFNNDENPDLLISLYNYPQNSFNDPSPAIYQFEFNGFEFEAVNEILLDVNYINSINLHDCDQDGDSDILAFSQVENTVLIIENLDEIFNPEFDELSDGLAGITGTLSTDIDGDFDLDILVASSGNGKIFLYERDETGAFLPQQIIFSDVRGVDIFLAEDLDQDGDVDLILRDDSDLGVYWIENNGDGSFTNTHDLEGYNSTNLSMDLKDFDGDGILDILYLHGTSQFYVWKGDGNGEFVESPTFGANEMGTFLDRTIFDVDEDGFLDIVGYFETNEDERHIGWYENDENGNFNDFHFISPMVYEYNFCQIEHSDLNQDGLPDLIALSSPHSAQEMSSVHVLYNLGAGNFSSPVLIVNNLNRVAQMGLTDLNLDGFPDLVLSRVNNYYSSNIGLINTPINQYLHIYHNDGTGQLLDPELFYADGSFFDIILFPDLDSDADPDMILSSSTLSEIFVIPNQTYSPVRVSGEIFLDENQNGIKDSTETHINWLEITSDPQAANYFLTDTGHYFLSYGDYEETYTIAPQLPISWGVSSEADSYTYTIDSDFVELDTLNFGVYPLEELPNFHVDLTGGVARCNQHVPYWIEIDNQGTTVGSGSIHLELDDLLDYVEADVEPDSIVGQNIYWHFDSLGFYEYTGIVVTVDMPGFQSIGEVMTSTIESIVVGDGESLLDSMKSIADSIIIELYGKVFFDNNVAFKYHGNLAVYDSISYDSETYWSAKKQLGYWVFPVKEKPNTFTLDYTIKLDESHFYYDLLRIDLDSLGKQIDESSPHYVTFKERKKTDISKFSLTYDKAIDICKNYGLIISDSLEFEACLRYGFMRARDYAGEYYFEVKQLYDTKMEENCPKKCTNTLFWEIWRINPWTSELKYHQKVKQFQHWSNGHGHDGETGDIE